VPGIRDLRDDRRSPLTGESRRAAILELLARDGQVLTSELARRFGVALVTVHRDLQFLSEAGELQRVHGGARTKDRGQAMPLTDWTARLGRRRAEKAQIARLAVTRIGEGSTVFIDASSTCLAVAHEIGRRPPAALTVVTNSPVIAAEFHEESVHVVITPGEVDQNLRLIAGPWTVEFLEGLRFQHAFVSAAGLTLQQGLATTRRPLADVIRAAHASALHVHALIDSSKFGVPAMVSMLDPREVDEVIVDDQLPDDVREEYLRSGVAVAVATDRADESVDR
jgi:DeoR family fructose operon transcriptional repressor